MESLWTHQFAILPPFIQIATYVAGDISASTDEERMSTTVYILEMAKTDSNLSHRIIIHTLSSDFVFKAWSSGEI